MYSGAATKALKMIIDISRGKKMQSHKMQLKLHKAEKEKKEKVQ